LAVGEGVVLRTTDGGDHWTAAASGVPSGDLEAVFMFPDNATAYASGSDKTLVKSVNGGQDWTDASGGLPDINVTGGGPTPYNVDAMWWTSPSVGWLAGDRVNSTDPGLILQTTDGGSNWAVSNSNTNVQGYESMMFTDANHGWAVGDCFVQQQIQKTPIKRALAAQCVAAISRWNGTQWEDVSPAQAQGGYGLQGVWFIDANHGWAVAENGSGAPTERLILFSSDGGTTWTVQSDTDSGNTTSGLNFVYAVDICHAWAVGGDSLILGFTDACPVAAVAAVPTLPKSGHPAQAPAWGWLAATVSAIAAAGGVTLLRQKR
jgi:photosystem II stability/assembly factor-like uncharacterized protein